MREEAIKKIEKEANEFRGGHKETAIAPYVATVLKKMAENQIIAKAITESEKTLSDCCKEIVEGTRTHISDMEVYAKAARFYFKNAKVDIVMRIEAEGIETTQEGIKDDELTKITKVAEPKKDKKKDVSFFKDEKEKEESDQEPEQKKEPLEEKSKKKGPDKPKQAAIIQLSLFD